MDPSPPSAPHRESRWGAAAAIVAVIGVQLALPNGLMFGPHWLLPTAELFLLLAVIVSNPTKLSRESRDVRIASIALVLLIAGTNAVSLWLLVDSLLTSGIASGRSLILAAIGIWLTNVVVFALAYWELDRRGPHARSMGKAVRPDLLFPQMTLDQADAASWAPAFVDYLYVSFTNSSAFSPTDTLPLTRRIKMLMLSQSLLSLVTIALVGARAVNILR